MLYSLNDITINVEKIEYISDNVDYLYIHFGSGEVITVKKCGKFKGLTHRSLYRNMISGFYPIGGNDK